MPFVPEIANFNVILGNQILLRSGQSPRHCRVAGLPLEIDKMNVLKSPLDVCRLAEGSNKPSYLEVYTRNCYGAKPEEIWEALHEQLSSLKLRLAEGGNCEADRVWLKAVETAPRLRALDRLLFMKDMRYLAKKFVPKAVSRTILSAHLGSSLTYIEFKRLTFHAQMGRWLGRALAMLKLLQNINLNLCVLFGTCEEIIANSLSIAQFSVNVWSRTMPVEFLRIPPLQKSQSGRRGYIWLTGSGLTFGRLVSRCILSKIEKLSGVTAAKQCLDEAELPSGYVEGMKYLVSRYGV